MTHSRPARIAFVDDNRDDLVLARLAFRRAGLALDFESFATGERFLAAMAARAAARTPPPDLAIIDLNLPLMRGSDVIGRARAEAWSAATILGICSGSADPADRALCAEAGAAFFLNKPVTAATLADIAAACPQVRLAEHDGARTLLVAG